LKIETVRIWATKRIFSIESVRF